MKNMVRRNNPEPQDDRSLLKKAQQGDFNARELLTERNLPLVKSMAKRFFYCGKESEDLFQVGCIGLIKAIDRFDLNMPVCFSTYAVPLIIGEIRRYLRDDRPVSISRKIRQQAIYIEKVRRELRIEEGREPDLQQLAKNCRLSVEQILTARGSQSLTIPLSEVLNRNNDNDYAEDRLEQLATDENEKITERLNMARMLDELPERLAYIVRGRYFEEKTQSTLAKELAISQVQVSRLEKKALGMIKEKMTAV